MLWLEFSKELTHILLWIWISVTLKFVILTLYNLFNNKLKLNWCRIFGKELVRHEWSPILATVCSVRPNRVWWMYTEIVRPILTYGSIVWWRAMDKYCNQTKLERVLRIVEPDNAGAVKTTPTDAFNVLLHMLPIDLHMKVNFSCRFCPARSNGQHFSCSPSWGIMEGGAIFMALVTELSKNFNVQFSSR